MTAQLIALLTPSAQKPLGAELLHLREQAEHLFLAGDVVQKDAMALLAEAILSQDARQSPQLTTQLRALFTRAYRDPTPSLRSALSLIEDALTQAPPESSLGLRDATRSLRSALKAIERGPDDAMARYALAADALEDVRRYLDRAYPMHAAIQSLIKNLEQPSVPLTDKVRRLSRSVESINPQAEGAMALKETLQAAVENLTDTLGLQALSRPIAKTANTAAQPSPITTGTPQIISALYHGVPLEHVFSRAIAITRLSSAQMPKELLASAEAAFLGGVSFSQVDPTSKHAARMDRLINQLLPNDRALIQAGLRGKLDLQTAVALNVPIFKNYGTPPALSPGEEIDASAEATRYRSAVQTLQEAVKRIPMRAAKAALDARQTLATLDPLGELMDKLQAVESQLTPTVAALNDTMSGRAFESVLSTRLLEHMPESTKAAWSNMAQGMAHVITHHESLNDRANWDKMNKSMRYEILKRKSRPWDKSAPQMQALYQLARRPRANMLDAVKDVLQSPVVTGHDVMAQANLVRDVWVALQVSGFVAPMGPVTNAFYREVIGPRTGRPEARTAVMDRQLAEAPPAKRMPNPALRTATGIMARHQPVPLGNQDALEAMLPGLVNNVDVNHSKVAEAVRQGGVTASGVSGSVNILVHFAEYARTELNLDISARDAFLGAMQFVLHDGGHSIQEALWVQDHFLDGKHSLEQIHAPSQSYNELKLAFSDVPEVQQAFAEAMGDLVNYYKTLPKTAAAATAQQDPS